MKNSSISLFRQILDLVPKHEFEKIIMKHNGNKHKQTFDCWAHFVSMIFCQLAQANSLREICGGLKTCGGKLNHLGVESVPTKSNLSYANAHRSPKIFGDIFHMLLGHCKTIAPRHEFSFPKKLYSLDATLIELCVKAFPWATYRQTKGAIKLNMLLDHDGHLPVFVDFTNGDVHEVNSARRMELPRDSMVVCDRGYVDFSMLYKWNLSGVDFVTRLKANATYDVPEYDIKQYPGTVLSDEVIFLRGSQDKYPERLRKVVVCDVENHRTLTLLTNNFELDAQTIGDIYKARWQIESFFKMLKQNFKIKTFIGTSENAVRIQVWTALIAILLTKYLKFLSKAKWHFSTLVTFLKWNLFVTPERLAGGFLSFLREKVPGGVRLMVIDEAHMICEAGPNFRPLYYELSHVRELLGSPQLMLVTATAGKAVIGEISQRFRLDPQQVKRESVVRRGVRLKVNRISRKGQHYTSTVDFVNSAGGRPVLIYGLTIRYIHSLQTELQKKFPRLDIRVYDAELTIKERNENHLAFLHNKAQVMIATKAYGMGIDKPDIWAARKGEPLSFNIHGNRQTGYLGRIV